MRILAITSNPHKKAEYTEHFGLYGIKKSLMFRKEMSEQDILFWLAEHREDDPIVFREEADLFEDRGGRAIQRPYRRADYSGKACSNISKATVYRLTANNSLARVEIMARIPGQLINPEREQADQTFDWDDVFKPLKHSLTYQDAKSSPGKISARSLVLDDIVARFVPFRSNRAFKYGRQNNAGMVDLNWWPTKPTLPIDFKVLPVDVLATNPLLTHERVKDAPITRMLRSAVSQGAHFRAASNRREWLYWAPGINAGVPLTPKEDEVAELIYLAHDFAHYALPDLMVDTPKGSLVDKIIVAHRMIGETMAMVSADMFLMDTFVKAEIPADADKHGIHTIFRLSGLDQRDQEESFPIALEAASHALLLGDESKFRNLLPKTKEATEALRRFKAKYSKFALADFEWTYRNLQEMHRHQERQSAWIKLVPQGALNELGLMTSSQFAKELPGLDENSTLEGIINCVRDRITSTSLMPHMGTLSERDRAAVLSSTLRRYFVGQMAIFGRYPELTEDSQSLTALQDAIANPALSLDDARKARVLYREDLMRLAKEQKITPIDAQVYDTAYPIVRPHYVSYANPNYASYEQIQDLLAGS